MSRDAAGLARAGLHLLVLSSLAIAQPLLDLLGRNPAFFSVRGSTRGEVVAFAAAVLLVPPAVLLLAVGLAALASRRAGRISAVLAVSALVAALALEALKRADGGATWWPVAGAIAIGLCAGTLYERAPPAGMFLSVLAPVPLVVGGLFLIHSPASRLVLSHRPHVQLADVRPGAPVVLVIFDEFSSTTLLNAHGRIDAGRFPNFARLARTATWYRDATTVAPWTTEAVPAILTGRLPRSGRVPVYRDYPQSVYTLLGRSYAIDDFETLTHLCPYELCRPKPARQPVPPDTGTLASDAGVVYLHTLLPGRLEERLPSLEGRWGAFRRGGATGEESVSDPTATFEAFLRSLRPRARPTLSVLHVNLPHFPWQFFPSGRRYMRSFEPVPGVGPGEMWGPDRWLVLQGWQRYLLQTGYVDRLLGRLVRRLEAAGLYDRSLLVVTADHGVSFRPGDGRRALTGTSARDIAFTPLFVKAPDQRRGRIVDAAVRTIDVLPTIASLLGMRIPWQVDGVAAGERRFDPDQQLDIGDGRFRFGTLLRERRESLSRQLRLFGSGGWAHVLKVAPGHQELLGKPPSGRLITTVDAGSSYVTGVYGQPGELLAVVVNGRIRALTRTYRFAGRTRFGALLPESLARHRVAVFNVPVGDLDGPEREGSGSVSARNRPNADSSLWSQASPSRSISNVGHC